MCKKLIFVLALLAMVVPASAFSRGVFEDEAAYEGDMTVVQVDIDGEGNSGPNDTQAGWEAWEMPSYWSGFGDQSKVFNTTMGPALITIGSDDQFNASRDRVDGITEGYENDFSEMLTDFVYRDGYGAGSLVCGMDYISIELTFNPMYAGHRMAITTFGWDTAFNGSGYGQGAGEPANSKWAAWSEENPAAWLLANGFDANGYSYGPTLESNMPAGLMDLVEGYALVQGRGPWLTALDDSYGMTFGATTYVTLDGQGKAKIYGWMDAHSNSGSRHLPLSGFSINLPEPATIALLGLGGMALIRRKR